MKLVFFGTPEYVVPVADGLLRHFRSNANPHPITAVITQSPKPSGRDQMMTYSPVDEWAYNKKIPKYFDPMDIIKNSVDADIAVLASYGEIIPDSVIKYFKYGILNIHPSLLPLWRGASPVQAAIISGERKTGVSIIKLDEKLDHGALVSQFNDEVLDSDTCESLRKRLFEQSAEVMPSLIEAYVAGKIKPKKQDEEKAIFTRQIKKEDAYIQPDYLKAVLDGKSKREKMIIPFIYQKIQNLHPADGKLKSDSFSKELFKLPITAEDINNFIRAMSPWPGVWTLFRPSTLLRTSSYAELRKDRSEGQGQRLKIISAHLDNSKLVLDAVQLEGKSPVTWKQFCEGYPKFKF